MTKKANHLATVVDRNIVTLIEVRRQIDRQKGYGAKIADSITRFCGSLAFVYFHIVWFAGWILWNTEILGEAFDPYPFGLLTTIVSLEAIFLSMFVLISQNRMTEIADQRADLDLQINLLAEYEITKILKIVDGIADHLKIKVGQDPEIEELKVEIHPREMLQEMERMKSGI